MDSSNYNKLSDIFESNKSNSSPNENDSNSLKDHFDLFNQDKEEKKIENNNNSSENSGKNTEPNNNSEKDKNEGKNCLDSSKIVEKPETIPKKKDKPKIKKSSSLGRNVTSFKKKPKKIEIDDMKFLFGEKALQMFELLDIIKIKTPKNKSGDFEVFIRKKHMKVFSEFQFFRKENWTINSDNTNILYQENFEIEEFNGPVMNIEDNIFEGNINDNDEDIIHFENIWNINVNRPGYNIIPNEEIANPFEQLEMMPENQNLSTNSFFPVNETSANTT